MERCKRVRCSGKDKALENGNMVGITPKRGLVYYLQDKQRLLSQLRPSRNLHLMCTCGFGAGSPWSSSLAGAQDRIALGQLQVLDEISYDCHPQGKILPARCPRTNFWGEGDVLGQKDVP